MDHDPNPFAPVRLFPTFFICTFLGGVWGFTATSILGVAAFSTGINVLGWFCLNSANLLFSLYWVGRVTGMKSKNGNLVRAKQLKFEQILGVMSFTVGYGTAWALLCAVAWAILR
ncbi:hypothetical protein EON80_10250 [bacterium]|nr:MAG: hypothetical protein EON80_10250 [bacterium]